MNLYCVRPSLTGPETHTKGNGQVTNTFCINTTRPKVWLCPIWRSRNIVSLFLLCRWDVMRCAVSLNIRGLRPFTNFTNNKHLWMRDVHLFALYLASVYFAWEWLCRWLPPHWIWPEAELRITGGQPSVGWTNISSAAVLSKATECRGAFCIVFTLYLQPRLGFSSVGILCHVLCIWYEIWREKKYVQHHVYQVFLSVNVSDGMVSWCGEHCSVQCTALTILPPGVLYKCTLQCCTLYSIGRPMLPR